MNTPEGFPVEFNPDNVPVEELCVPAKPRQDVQLHHVLQQGQLAPHPPVPDTRQCHLWSNWQSQAGTKAD